MPEYSNQVPLGADAAEDLDYFRGSRPHALKFGGIPDARRVSDGAMTAASAVLTSASGLFRTKHVGRTIVVPGAGIAGAVLITTIAGYTSPTSVTLAVAATTTVSSAVIVWGTDNATAFTNAVTSIEGGGNALYLDGGLYLTTGTITLSGNFKIYGPCHRLDIPHTQQQSGRYACILTTANPGIFVGPYPGVELRDVIIEGVGTTTVIETYEETFYDGQIGIWAGYIGTPLTLPTDDYGAGPGSGGLTMKGVTFSRFGGWGLYAYKLYGKSFFDRCRFYQCGQLPTGATEDQIDRHGGAMLNSETVDFEMTSCHFLGTFSGTDRCGTGLKLGAKSTDAAAMNRFYLGTSHAVVQNCLIEGQWFRGSADYFSIASKFDGVVYGDVREVVIGENPFVSTLNKSGWYRNIDLSGANIVVKCYAERVVLDGFLSESSAAKTIRYWYSGPVIKNCKNITLEPSGNKSLITRNSELWDNRPLAFTDQPNDGVNLLPNYHKTGGWTITAAPTGLRFDRWKVKIYNSATAFTTITGLAPGTVYSFGFFCGITASFAEMVTYRLEDGSAVEILANQIGETAVDILTTNFYVMVNFVAPADGTVKVIFKNDSPNQVEFNAPWIVKGFVDKITHGGYEFSGNPQTGAVTGRSVDAAGEWEHFDTIMSRKFGGHAANLTARRQSFVGLGANIHHDGTEWITGYDATNNGAGAVLTSPGDGNLGIYAVPTTGTGQPQKLNDAALAALLRVFIETNERLTQFGTAGAEQNICQRKRGSAASPTNVEYRLSHRSNGEDWMIIGYDGTTSWIVMETDYSAGKVYVNGVDVTNLFPAGATAGMFLRSDGGTARSWQKVDVGDATNVKFAGVVNGRPVIGITSGALAQAVLSIANVGHMTSPYADGDILTTAGGQVSYFTITALGGLLAADSAFIASLKGALDHTHDYNDRSADSPTGTNSGHSHSVSNSDDARTSATANW